MIEAKVSGVQGSFSAALGVRGHSGLHENKTEKQKGEEGENKRHGSHKEGFIFTRANLGFFFLIYIPPLRNSHTFNLQKKLIPKCCKGVGEK